MNILLVCMKCEAGLERGREGEGGEGCGQRKGAARVQFEENESGEGLQGAIVNGRSRDSIDADLEFWAG